MLYSAANGNWHPWALPQLIRFGLGFGAMLVMAFVDIRIFLRFSYWIYFIVLGLLFIVEVAGDVGMGAQRWINLGFMKLQPSELMKIALIMALAKYFNSITLQRIESIKGIILPLAMVLLPVGLVLMQPDLYSKMILTILILQETKLVVKLSFLPTILTDLQ